MALKGADVFSGCGGMSKGFTLAGIDVRTAMDCWEKALIVYQDNFPDHDVYQIDLSEQKEAVKILKEAKPDIIFGGPPCRMYTLLVGGSSCPSVFILFAYRFHFSTEDFSTANQNRSEGERAALTVSFAKIVTQVKPTWFVMENVRNALKSQAFKDATAVFTKGGYNVTTVVLNAAYYNCPQERKRMFCIGTRLPKSKLDLVVNRLHETASEKKMTVREFLEPGEWGDYDYYWLLPRNYRDKGIRAIDDTCATIRGINGGIPANYKPNGRDATHDMSHIKLLTPREVSRIQTFPKDWIWNESIGKTIQQKLIGNAVAVNLAKAVASAVVYAHEHSG